MTKTILVAAVLCALGTSHLSAQGHINVVPRSGGNYQVHTFDRVDQNAVAQDRAAMAASDNARHEAWARYQQQLAEQRATAIRLKQQGNEVIAYRERQAQLDRERKDVIEMAAATKAVEDVLKEGENRKALQKTKEELAADGDEPWTTTLYKSGMAIGLVGITALFIRAIYKSAMASGQIFRNPQNGYIVTRANASLGSLLFGSLYFAALGIWTHAIVSLIAAVLTFGVSWLIYPFFAQGIVRNHYLSKGWEIL